MVRKTTIWFVLLSFFCTVIVTWCGVKFIDSQFYLVSIFYFSCFLLFFKSIYNCVKKHKNNLLEIAVSIDCMVALTSLLGAKNEYGNLPKESCFYVFACSLILLFVLLVIIMSIRDNQRNK